MHNIYKDAWKRLISSENVDFDEIRRIHKALKNNESPDTFTTPEYILP